jgi:GNAT superfamily N-acetyltransferase
MADADVDRVAPVLARAFDQDPLFLWVEPDPVPREAFLVAYMRALARRSHILAEAFTTAPEPLGAALWKGPELGRLSEEQFRRAGFPEALALLSGPAQGRLAALLAVEDILEREIPLPRWYLGVLAVGPEAQGQGRGGRLLQPILERADREGLPVSLETLRERNVGYYERLGFEIAARGRLAGGGPPFWVMRRGPRGETARPVPRESNP